MSWLWGGKQKELSAEGTPSNDMCKIYRDSIEFVHHNARVDGTMVKAWEDERSLLQNQIQVLKKHPGNDKKIQQFQKEIEHINSNIELSGKPEEAQRMNRMCEMHTHFVRTLESTVPLLRAKCPNQNWTVQLDDDEMELLKQQQMLDGGFQPRRRT